MTNKTKKTKTQEAYWLGERESYFDGLHEEIENLKEKGIFTGKKIAIVGAWNNLTKIDEIMRKLELEISYIADNNPKKQGLSRIGIVARSIESLTECADVVILILNNHFWKELLLQITKLGYIENTDLFVLFGGDKLKADSISKDKLILLDNDWISRKEQIEKAYKEYLHLQDSFGKKEMWLMHPSSLGDLYIFSLFLPYYYNVSSIAECDCIIIVTKNSVKKLAIAIGYKNIHLVSLEEAKKGWLPLIALMGDEVKIKNAVSYGLNDVFGTIRNYTALNFMDSFIDYVFDFDKMPNPIYHTFSRRDEVIMKIFTDKGLIPGKTVLLSPYAGHFVSNISKKQWAELVLKIKAKGYTVCTNCGNATEEPIEGSPAVFIEIQDCERFVELAGVFIGIRSGLCDLVCMADATKIVINEIGVPAGSDRYFSFKEMGIGRNVIEVTDDCVNTDAILDGLLTWL